MSGTGNFNAKEIQFNKPDMIDMVYIQQLEKSAVSKERMKTIMSVVWIVICLVLIVYFMFESFGKLFIPALLLLLIPLIILFLINLFRLQNTKGDPEKYGIIKGTVTDSRIRVYYRRQGLNKRVEFVDVLCENGQMCREAEVFQSTMDDYSMATMSGTRFLPGDPIKLIRLNERKVYAVR